uniref:DNA polymerase eta n=1 Tax=Coccidioides posadasii RMSCC 3488 TaxID=454284 RepID=A0A0J6FFT7_COCPO|nr:sister chromatid cohesion protein Eso1 [Coccidioides posadasii RMSCC 3488]
MAPSVLTGLIDPSLPAATTMDTISSSPLHTHYISQFTHRNLQLLRTFSPRTPLRVVAHIDLDAFYAQCEMVRLNTPRTQPLAVQQWESLIAVNYAARSFNISRMITAKEAKARCPQLMTVHVATFREGEGGKWAYREDGDHNVATDKVSLDPYRAESRKILGTIKDGLVAWAEKVDPCGLGERRTESGGSVKEKEKDWTNMVRIEKAGIDEVFIDLSALVWATLLERYPMLQEMEVKRQMSERLPRPPTTALDWGKEDELVDLDEGETEEDDPDWDDMVMLVGADIVRSVRLMIRERLGYTCSAGIARNKMMAKLGSACNKPNKQTIVRNRAIQQFLGGFKFTKIRMLGGKLGKQIASTFETEQVDELLRVPLEQFKAKLDDDTGMWLYELIRGNDWSEVNPRTQIKSMISTKSFRPGINSLEQAEKWLRIFAAEIYGRLVEEGVLEHKRRPKVLTIHHRHSGHTKSRQVPIPTGMAIDEEPLFALAKDLLKQVTNEGHMWPCMNLALTVSGFEDGVSGNQSLDSFFTRATDTEKKTPVSLRRHLEGEDNTSESHPSKTLKLHHDFDRYSPLDTGIDDEGTHTAESLMLGSKGVLSTDSSPEPQLGMFPCSKCRKLIPEAGFDEHEDWHFAKDLQLQERRMVHYKNTNRGLDKSRGKRQTRLAFG